MRNEQEKEGSCRKELEVMNAKLRHISKEKDRVWKAFELTGDEAKFTSEIKGIMNQINELEQRKAELEARIEQLAQAETDIKAIEHYCETVSRNLGNLSFTEKRNMLEVLRIRVISGAQITIEGIIPIVSGQYA